MNAPGLRAMRKTVGKTNRITLLRAWWGGWLVLTEIRVNEMILMRNSLPACLQFLPDPPVAPRRSRVLTPPAGTQQVNPSTEQLQQLQEPAEVTWAPQLRVLPDVHSAKCATTASSAATQMCSSLGCCSREQHHSCGPQTPRSYQLCHICARCAQAPPVPSPAVLTPPFSAIPPAARSCLCPRPTCAPLLHPAVPSCTQKTSCAQLLPASSCANLLPASSCSRLLPIQLRPRGAPWRPQVVPAPPCPASFSSQSPNSSVPLLNTPSRL